MIGTTKKIEGVHRASNVHWVGDGFRVITYFSADSAVGRRLSPFVLLDYHPPHEYAPAPHRLRGVGPHPHRGFETVTVAFEGSVAHHDSAGNAGIIGPGDVQWMTAGAGILHREYHEREFARRGGRMHMMQLWVNLPRAHKMAPPAYQPLLAADMGRVPLADGRGQVTVIAGAYQGVKGPARTFSPINMYDIRLDAGGRVPMSFAAHENTALMVLSGDVRINGDVDAHASELVLFENDGEAIEVEARTAAHCLLLNGAPLDEPVVQYGPFVMNTEQEIRQAIADFNSGRFGTLEDEVQVH